MPHFAKLRVQYDLPIKSSDPHMMYVHHGIMPTVTVEGE